MAINTRQNGLLVAEDWKKVYQTFQEADFTSYDFETLRKSMIDYLRLYYPEDFNDFTDSSEFIALIDLIAFMGQSLAFRTDMNARENFIDTAERRDSILKLARLVSYNPKRCTPAAGYLKLDSVTTTETMYDSNGLNLSNLMVNWNDQSNDNWLEQFTTVINASLVNSQVVGKPGNTQVLNSVITEEYGLNLISNVLGVYKFTAAVEGGNVDFEAVSATSAGQSYIYEVPPASNSVFNLLYRNDNYGNASANTGFFVYFKQGTLASQNFNIAETLPNRVMNFNYSNINNTDVWLYDMSSANKVQNAWAAVPAVTGINVIYNKQSQRNLYQVNTKAGDQIDLVFGDGSFANIPFGNYRLYYRTSNGLSYKVTTDEMQGITIPFSYVSRSNRVETLTIRASLQYTVTNASARETTEDIRQKAPQQYYTQNRMITGEDYNILPFTTFTNVIKAKSINRTSAGISRYLDSLDPTGKYSSTNVFANDGILFKNSFIRNFKFNLVAFTNIAQLIDTQLSTPIIASTEMLHFYYANFPQYAVTGYTWNASTSGSNAATGYFIANSLPVQIGGVVKNNATYLRKGAIIKFRAANGYYFDANRNMLPGVSTKVTDTNDIYASIVDVVGDGSNNSTGNLATGVGPVSLNILVPSGAIIDQIYPAFKNIFTSEFSSLVVSLIKGFKNFGIGYNSVRQVWHIITADNLNAADTFSLTHETDSSGTGLDNSWIVRFAFDGAAYTTYYRGMEYIFQSVGETNFYYEPKTRIYDSKTSTVINDQITILRTNSSPDSAAPLGNAYTWYVYNNITGTDGYVSPDKMLVTYADSNGDGIIDNPALFELVVAPTVNVDNKLVFFKTIPGYDRFLDTIAISNDLVCSKYGSKTGILSALPLFRAGQLFYATSENQFYQLATDRTLAILTNYAAQVGRQDLSFQYQHNSPGSNRIDPTSSNIIDIYMLTSAYETAYRNWIRDTSNKLTMPAPPTSQELYTDFAGLNNLRSVSDTIVFNSAKFKPLFGIKADPKLQAMIKVVKNASIVTSDNDIKTSVINAVNTYFDINNWEFGETFYFSELSAYLHQALSPNIASIIIVPIDTSISFGSLFQINAEANEIIISAATVENVEIITALTANQLNLSLASSNSNILI